MLLNIRAKFDLFDVDDLLLLLGFLLPFLLFLAALAKTHDAANRRLRLRRNLDEVEMLLLCHAQCFARRHDAELFTRGARHANFADVDLFVDS